MAAQQSASLATRASPGSAVSSSWHGGTAVGMALSAGQLPAMHDGHHAEISGSRRRQAESALIGARLFIRADCRPCSVPMQAEKPDSGKDYPIGWAVLTN